NSAGLALGTNQTFLTEGPVPVALTSLATNISYTTASLAGIAPLLSASGDYYFEWGETTNYGKRVSASVQDPALLLDGFDDFVSFGWGLFPTVTNNFTIEVQAYPTGFRSATNESLGGFFDSLNGLGHQHYAIFPDQGAIAYGSSPHAGAGLSIGTNGISVV